MIHEIAERHQTIQNEGSYPSSSTRHNNQTRFRFPCHKNAYQIYALNVLCFGLNWGISTANGNVISMGSGYTR